jgi:hypothetical protein
MSLIMSVEPLNPAPIAVRNGLATIGSEAFKLWAELEACYLDWAARCGAAEYRFPAALPVADLDRLDYFRNFPHLAVLASGISAARSAEYASGGVAAEAVPATDLDPAALVLPPAACYSVYLHARGTQLAEPWRVTTVTTCARREAQFDGLRRLLSFTLREIVCVGARDDVLQHLDMAKKLMTGFLRTLGLPVRVVTASDPFFDQSTSRALVGRLFPVKEEILYGEDLAIASANFHRNFFGERCDITMPDGAVAFSGCVGFGIERWVCALRDEFGDDFSQLAARVRGARRESTDV